MNQRTPKEVGALVRDVDMLVTLKAHELVRTDPEQARTWGDMVDLVNTESTGVEFMPGRNPVGRCLEAGWVTPLPLQPFCDPVDLGIVRIKGSP
ncbi:MAG: hypothetical protein JJT81_20500 [Rubellimicrobium sp.]|nr:hypothetical protein [Rubellimicrobium sp.]